MRGSEVRWAFCVLRVGRHKVEVVESECYVFGPFDAVVNGLIAEPA